jgi:hypothetical protein
VLLLLLVSTTGFIAQLIDGSMGMAFGISSTTLLLFLGYSPAIASATVHLAEIGTSFTSGVAHIKHKNVDWNACVRVAIPGAIGALIGSLLLSSIDLTGAKSWTSSILLILGILLLFRFTRPLILGNQRRARARMLAPLGLAGGFVDATGGGGWGPIVTTVLTASDSLEPRKAIGTANTAEFVVSVSASIGFLIGLGSSNIPWKEVLALLVGGMLAAPLAAWLVAKAPSRIIGVCVGALVIILNLFTLTKAFELAGNLQIVIWTSTFLILFAGILRAIKLHRSESIN